MTILRRQDDDLHGPDGRSHIDPGRDRNLKARLKRHLDAHARNDLPELSMLRDDIKAADEGLKAAQEHRTALRAYVIDVARQYDDRGVDRTTIARKLGINRRTLFDWLEIGRAR